MMPLWLPTPTRAMDAHSQWREPWRPVTRCGRGFVTGYLLILSLCLTACQWPSWPAWPGDWLSGAQSSSTPTPRPIATHLTMWAWPAATAEDAYLQAQITHYQQMQPTVGIELSFTADYAARLRTALGSDNPPDLLYLNSFYLPDLVADGALAPVAEGLLFDADLDPRLRAAMFVAGTPYCIPKETDTLALLYNKTHFDAAGLAYPDESWDWERLRQSAEALTDLESGQYGIVLPPDFSRWLPFLAQGGGAIVNPEGTAMAINSPEAQAALDFYVNLVLEGFGAPPSMLDSRWPGEAFAKGRAAMAIEGNWMIPYLAEASPSLAYGVALLPSGPAGRATVSFTTCYAIAAASQHQAAALDVIVYLTAAEQAAGWLPLNRALPARLSLQQRWLEAYPTLLPFATGLDHAREWQLPAPLQPLVGTMNDSLRRTFGGFILAQSVLPTAELEGNAALAP